MKSGIDRDALARPAMPIESAAPSYHSSALKMTRRIRFLAALERDAARDVRWDPGFLAPLCLEVLLFDIIAPVTPCRKAAS
jgi:hypothetical protein